MTSLVHYCTDIDKGVSRIYQQTAVDNYSSVSFAKVYTAKGPVTAVDLRNDRVLPFFEHFDVSVLRVLTEQGTEYCVLPDNHPYQLMLCKEKNLAEKLAA